MTHETREPMDPFVAVFNEHVNNAGRRARKEMREKCPSYLARVLKRKREGGGIMAIFEPPYYRAFHRYALLVQAFVNGELGDAK
jgi:hypothetical protein